MKLLIAWILAALPLVIAAGTAPLCPQAFRGFSQICMKWTQSGQKDPLAISTDHNVAFSV